MLAAWVMLDGMLDLDAEDTRPAWRWLWWLLKDMWWLF